MITNKEKISGAIFFMSFIVIIFSVCLFIFGADAAGCQLVAAKLRGPL
jgi:hypothetical protein